jgi:hypothetical protein
MYRSVWLVYHSSFVGFENRIFPDFVNLVDDRINRVNEQL